MFNLKKAALVAGLAGIIAAPAFAGIQKTYDNTTNLTGTWANGGCMIADDLHLTANTPLTGIDVGYYCPEGESTGIVMFLYTGLETPSFASLYLGNVDAGTGIFHYNFEQPVGLHSYDTLPTTDIWAGILLTNSNAGLLLANDPTVGTSDAKCWIGGPGGPMYGPTTTVGTSNFALATYSDVPEPGALAMLGTGLVGLLGFRRRKSA